MEQHLCAKADLFEQSIGNGQVVSLVFRCPVSLTSGQCCIHASVNKVLLDHLVSKRRVAQCHFCQHWLCLTCSSDSIVENKHWKHWQCKHCPARQDNYCDDASIYVCPDGSIIVDSTNDKLVQVLEMCETTKKIPPCDNPLLLETISGEKQFEKVRRELEKDAHPLVSVTSIHLTASGYQLLDNPEYFAVQQKSAREKNKNVLLNVSHLYVGELPKGFLEYFCLGGAMQKYLSAPKKPQVLLDHFLHYLRQDPWLHVDYNPVVKDTMFSRKQTRELDEFNQAHFGQVLRFHHHNSASVLCTLAKYLFQFPSIRQVSVDALCDTPAFVDFMSRKKSRANLAGVASAVWKWIQSTGDTIGGLLGEDLDNRLNFGILCLSNFIRLFADTLSIHNSARLPGDHMKERNALWSLAYTSMVLTFLHCCLSSGDDARCAFLYDDYTRDQVEFMVHHKSGVQLFTLASCVTCFNRLHKVNICLSSFANGDAQLTCKMPSELRGDVRMIRVRASDWQKTLERRVEQVANASSNYDGQYDYEKTITGQMEQYARDQRKFLTRWVLHYRAEHGGNGLCQMIQEQLLEHRLRLVDRSGELCFSSSSLSPAQIRTFSLLMPMVSMLSAKDRKKIGAWLHSKW